MKMTPAFLSILFPNVPFISAVEYHFHFVRILKILFNEHECNYQSLFISPTDALYICLVVH